MTTKFTKNYRFRLLIGLPIVVICFTLAAGFLPLRMLDSSLSGVERPVELRPLVLTLELTVLVITLVAASLAVALSVYIVRPVELMVSEMDKLVHASESESAPAEERQTDDEIDRLAKVYNQAFVPIKGVLSLSDVFFQMNEGVISLGADGKIAFLNAQVERLLAINRREYIGRHYEQLFPDSGRNSEVHEVIEEALQKGVNRTRDILVSAASGRDVYVRTTVSPAVGRMKEPLGVVMLFQDIEEITRVKEQLRKVDVLASIGGTVSGLAHELRTPLGFVRGLAELLVQDLPKDSSQQKYAQTIIDSIERLNDMVGNILSLASGKVDTATTLDPLVVVRESIAYVREMISKNGLKLSENYVETDRSIQGDRQKLVECFMNILKNACEASPPGAALSVRVRPVVLAGSSKVEQQLVMIEFHNEGSYISPETKAKLFTPFFTTKKQGTGLGLAISKQIVEAHEGMIQVESDPGTGTLFRVLLPMTASPSTMHAESRS